LRRRKIGKKKCTIDTEGLIKVGVVVDVVEEARDAMRTIGLFHHGNNVVGTLIDGH